MDEIFKSILLMSAAGGVLSIILLCAKPFTKKLFSPKWQYYIWLSILVVMVLPLKLNISAVNPNMAKEPVNPVIINTEANTHIEREQETINTQEAINTYAGANEPQNRPQNAVSKIVLPDINIMQVLGFIWILAALIIFAYKLIKYAVFIKTLKRNSCVDFSIENIPKGLCVRRTNMLDAPLLAGVLKPVLYLPDISVNDEELNYILLHEITHYRRRDLLYKWFLMLVSCVHWFNPLVYIVSKQIDEDCEISCDYEAVKSLTEPQKRDYMSMILGFVSSSVIKRPLTSQMAGSRKTLERRFTMIKNTKSISRIMSFISALMAVFILSASVFASGVLAEFADGEKNLIVNGKGYDVKPVYVENERYLHTDSYYLPLREMFEALGCTVNYDVSREGLPSYWQINEYTPSFPDYEWRENLVTDDITSQVYGATYGVNSNMPIIEIVSPDGTKTYLQICAQTNGMSAPILIDGKAYVTLRDVALYLIPEDEDMQGSIIWDDAAHDIYFAGRLLWDEETQTVTINTDAGTGLSEYVSTITALNLDERRVMQRKENRNYMVCAVENFSDNNSETIIAVEKRSGRISVIESYGKEDAFRMYLNIEADDTFTLQRREANEEYNELINLNLKDLTYQSL